MLIYLYYFYCVILILSSQMISRTIISSGIIYFGYLQLIIHKFEKKHLSAITFLIYKYYFLQSLDAHPLTSCQLCRWDELKILFHSYIYISIIRLHDL